MGILSGIQESKTFIEIRFESTSHTFNNTQVTDKAGGLLVCDCGKLCNQRHLPTARIASER
jgi:hypothetical protein